MVRKTDISEAAAGAKPGMEAPAGVEPAKEALADAEPAMEASVPTRRAVLKAAASAPVILTVTGGPARAGYNVQGFYFEGSIDPNCVIPPPDPPRENPQNCPIS